MRDQRERLIEAGILERRLRDLSEDLLSEPPAPIASGVSVVEALLEERHAS